MKHADQLFLKALLEELEERNEVEALHLMHNIIDEARQEPTERERLHAWCVMEGRDDRAVTTELRDICGSHGDYWRDLSFSNSVDAIDAAALAAATDLLTGRTFEDRLFPAQEWDTGWTLSLQADMAGYQCAPKERLAHLEYYDAVEAVIYGPDGMLVDPTALDLPEDVVAKFTELEPGSGPAIGCKLTWEDVKAVRTALNMAGMNPNAGVPRGSIGWHGADLWHGTDKEAAEDIASHGVRIEASGRGYFGPAFYMADKRELAVSNYADAFDEDPGAVVHAQFADDVHILDLRNSKDAEEWAPYGDRVSDPNFDRIMRKAGIDGVYDRSMGGIAIYRVDAVSVLGVEDPKPDAKGEDGPGF